MTFLHSVYLKPPDFDVKVNKKRPLQSEFIVYFDKEPVAGLDLVPYNVQTSQISSYLFKLIGWFLISVKYR